MTEYRAENRAQLLDKIGAGSPEDPHDPGPECVTIHLWDGRDVIGTYTSKPADVSTEDFLFTDDEIAFFVDRLLAEEKPFVTSTEISGEGCDLEWSIRKSSIQ